MANDWVCCDCGETVEADRDDCQCGTSYSTADSPADNGSSVQAIGPDFESTSPAEPAFEFPRLIEEREEPHPRIDPIPDSELETIHSLNQPSMTRTERLDLFAHSLQARLFLNPIEVTDRGDRRTRRRRRRRQAHSNVSIPSPSTGLDAGG